MAKALTCLIVTITEEDESVTQKVVTESPFFIGRSHDCAIAFPRLNVSRQHVSVKNKGGNVWIEDLSANGTFVNGERIEKGRLKALAPGDLIRLGSAKAEISIESIERAFSEDAIDEADASDKDREGMMNLIHGAHAEALRLTNLGKEVHDNFVKAAEERAAQLEQKMTSNHAAILADAKNKARGILDQAQEDRKAMIAKAEKEAVDASHAMTEKIKVEARQRAERQAKEELRDEFMKIETLRAENEVAKEQVESARREIKAARVEMDKVREEAKAYRQQSENLKASIAEMREQEKRKDSLSDDIAKLAEQVENSEKQLKKRLSDNKAKIEDEIAEGRKLILAELAQFRVTEMERLKEDKREQDKQRADLAAQVTKLTEQLTSAEQQYKKIQLEHKATMEKERTEGRKAIDEEFTQMRLAEMERLKRDRAAAVAEISRERERLSQKILADMEKTAAKSMALDDWRQISGELKEILGHHLHLPTLSAGAEDISPLISKAARHQRFARWQYTGAGLVMGLLIWAGSGPALEALKGNPMKEAAEEQSRRVQEDLARRKFNPERDEEWREKYVDAVIYTRGFVEQYRSEEFQKHWVKKASTYFLKQWKVQEESTVAAIAKVTTLVGTLAERKEAIHPDFVQEGLKKMNEIEAQTTTEIQELLGSEVRFEAFKRLEKKTYLEFHALRQPATSKPAPPPVKKETAPAPQPVLELEENAEAEVESGQD